MPFAGIKWFSDIIPFSARYEAMLCCEDHLATNNNELSGWDTRKTAEMLDFEVPRRIEGFGEYFAEYSQHAPQTGRFRHLAPQRGLVLCSRGGLSRANKMSNTRDHLGVKLITSEIEKCHISGIPFTRLRQREIMEAITIIHASGLPGVYVNVGMDESLFYLGESQNVKARHSGHKNSDLMCLLAFLTWGKPEARSLQDDLFLAIDKYIVWRRMANRPIGKQGSLRFERGVKAHEFILSIVNNTPKLRDQVRRVVDPRDPLEPVRLY